MIMKRKHKGRADIWIRVIALIATLATIGAVAYVQFSGTGSKLEEAVTNLESGITTPSDSGTEPAPSVEEEETSSSYSGFFPIIDETNPVDKSYFEDAVFIGDSLLNGLKLNSEIGTVADWLVNDDMTVDSAKRISISTPSGSTTLMDALAAKKYAKVYVMMGINDLTAPAKDWAAQYEELLADITKAQPDAIMYVMAVMPASEQAVARRESLGVQNIVAHNQALFKVLWANGYYYLDTWGEFADAHGYLASEDNTDGIHLTTAKYKQMYEYICGRTIEA